MTKRELTKPYEPNPALRAIYHRFCTLKGGFSEQLTNDALYNSPADWISPFGGSDYEGFMTNPPVPDGSKVFIPDTDHIWGDGEQLAVVGEPGSELEWHGQNMLVEGQKPRPWQANATSFCSEQLGQASSAKPRASTPQAT